MENRMRTAYLVATVAPATKQQIDDATEVVVLAPETSKTNDTTDEAQALLNNAHWLGLVFVSVAYSGDEAKQYVLNYFLERGVEPISLQVLDLSEHELRSDLLPDDKTRRMPGMVSKLDPMFILADRSNGQLIDLVKFSKTLFSKD